MRAPVRLRTAVLILLSGAVPAAFVACGSGPGPSPATSGLQAPNVEGALDGFFRAVPAADTLKRLLARGVERDYRLFRLEHGLRAEEVIPEPWRGVILLRDPAEDGTLIRRELTTPDWELVRAATGVNPVDWWYRNPEGTYSKRILGAGDRLVGSITMGPGRRVTIALDGDGDRIVDLFETAWVETTPGGSARFRELVFANEHGPGLGMLDQIWRGRNPFCPRPGGVASAGTDVTGPSGPSAPTPGAVDATDACSRSGDSGEGGGGVGYEGQGDEGSSGIGGECGRILESGSPGPAAGFTQETWAGQAGESTTGFITHGFDGEEDSATTKTVRTVFGGWIVVGAATYGTAQAETIVDIVTLGTIDKGGDDEPTTEPTEPTPAPSEDPPEEEDRTYFDTDDDGELDAKDTDGDGEPDASCNPCGGAGGAGGGPPGQPYGGPGGTESPTTYGQARYEACARQARRQHWLEGRDPVGEGPVTQRCENPAGDPSPYAGREAREGGQVELDTYCGNRDEGRGPNIADVLGGDQGGGDDCGAIFQPGPGQRSCGGIGWTFGGSRGTIGVGLGTLFGIETCDPTYCRESPERR